MRIIDCFTDVILYARRFSRGEIDVESAEEVRVELKSLIEKSKILSEQNGMSVETFNAAKYPVVAYIDELFMCSKWRDKGSWQIKSLQRIYFNTTNAGSVFYERLSILNKYGPDKDIREVYALCMGLGFRGKYFRGEDRQQYEEIKAFNLSLLLPDEAQRNIDSETLFPLAYREHSKEGTGSFIPRLNIYPIIIGVPIAVILILALVYRLNIGASLDSIQDLIKY